MGTSRRRWEGEQLRDLGGNSRLTKRSTTRHAAARGTPSLRGPGGCGRRGAAAVKAPEQNPPPFPVVFCPPPQPGRVRTAASPRRGQRGAPSPHWRVALCHSVFCPLRGQKGTSEDRARSSEGLTQLYPSAAFTDRPFALPAAFLPLFFFPPIFFFFLGTTVFRFGVGFFFPPPFFLCKVACKTRDD